MELDSPIVLQTVQWLATHAVLVFSAALLGLLLGVTALWWLVLRYGVYRETSRLPQAGYQVGYMVAGFALITGAAAFFAEVAENLGDNASGGEGRQLGRLDDVFSSTLGHTVARSALEVFALVTRLGDASTQTGVCIALALLLLVQRRYTLGISWVLAVAGNGILNRTLKAIFQRVRPVHDHGLAFADGWSFPSGHASGSVVVYGMLAYVALRLLPATHAAWRLPIVLLAAAIAFSTGASRVFLQVHYASDVLAGFASGSAWLAVCIAAHEWLLRRQARKAA